MKFTPFALAAGLVMLGSLMASSAAIWVRFLPGQSPIAIAFIRVAGAALLLLPWFWRDWRRRGGLSWRELRFSLLAGVALALHFATWITSLQYTTVAHSVLFVATHPMFVIAISVGLLRVPVARNQIVGATVALAGVAFIQWRDLDVTGAGGLFTGQAQGDLLALAGGLFAAIYLLLGQEARRNLSTILHVEVTYAAAAVVLLAMVLVLRVPLSPLVAESWIYLALLVLLPTVGGHTIFNWGLRRLGAPLVSLFGLLEPVEAAVLALIFLGEGLPATTVLGAGVVLGGLGLAVWRPASPAAGLNRS